MKTNNSLKDLMEKVGIALANLRLEKGYDSLKEFTRTYDLPMIQYWRIEKGKTNLTLKSLHKLLSIHHMSLPQFFCYLDK